MAPTLEAVEEAHAIRFYEKDVLSPKNVAVQIEELKTTTQHHIDDYPHSPASDVTEEILQTSQLDLEDINIESHSIEHDPRLILHHSNVAADFDELRFNAAASRQLDTPSHSADLSPWLVSSPYNASPHLLDLRRLDIPYVLFAKALTALRPIRPDYATAPYEESLNFDEVLTKLRDLSSQAGYEWREQSFYLVIFRSRLKPNIDNDYLYEVDAKSHQEATQSGGLLKYWFGKANDDRRNLATCLWRNREDARLGGRGPWHAKARRAARDLYEKIDFAVHRFVITDGAREWRIEEWNE